MSEARSKKSKTKQRKVYSLPPDAKLPKKYGRVAIYVDSHVSWYLTKDGLVPRGRRYAFVGWVPTYGDCDAVRKGRIKLTARL